MKLLAGVAALCVACGGKAVIDGDGAGGGGAGAGGTGMNMTTGSGMGTCTEARVGTLCLRGQPSGANEVLTSSIIPRFEVSPAGCFSSSCTDVHEATCTAISGDPEVRVRGSFCLEDTSAQQGGCTADCASITASCSLQGPLPDGGYSVSESEVLTLLFTVPMTMPSGGTCVGAEF